MMTITHRTYMNLQRKGFKVYSRQAWGSQYPGVYAARRVLKPAITPADTVVQHITVTLDHGPLSGDFKTDMRTIERIGQERFSSGISYNWVVDMTTGEIGVGQPLDAKGTHTVNDKGVPNFTYDQNLVARSIAVLGMPNYKLKWRARRSIVGIMVAMVEEGAVTRGFDYVPHSLFAAKDCPCDSTRDAMPRMRRRVANQVGVL